MKNNISYELLIQPAALPNGVERNDVSSTELLRSASDAGQAADLLAVEQLIFQLRVDTFFQRTLGGKANGRMWKSWAKMSVRTPGSCASS
mgnify:CR=1 FL=1